MGDAPLQPRVQCPGAVRLDERRKLADAGDLGAQCTAGDVLALALTCTLAFAVAFTLAVAIALTFTVADAVALACTLALPVTTAVQLYSTGHPRSHNSRFGLRPAVCRKLWARRERCGLESAHQAALLIGDGPRLLQATH